MGSSYGNSEKSQKFETSSEIGWYIYDRFIMGYTLYIYTYVHICTYMYFEKYEFVSWDWHSPFLENKIHVPNQQQAIITGWCMIIVINQHYYTMGLKTNIVS